MLWWMWAALPSPFFALCNSGSKTQTHATKETAPAFQMHRHIIHIHKPDQNTMCINAHFSWLLKHRIQETTNASRLSLEASSKFSTSLARMFLLQRETALMATFHTQITRNHYSVFGGGGGGADL